MAKTAHTHTLYAFSRQGKKHGPMLECGTGRVEGRIIHIYQDRTPVTGYTGYMVLTEIGAPPPKPIPPPDEDDEDHDEPVRPSSIQPTR
jgi:hypothetical protein